MSHMKYPFAVLLVVAFQIAGPKPEKAEDESADKVAKHRAAQAALLRGALPVLSFEIADEDIEALRREPRRYVQAHLTADGKTMKGVAVKLKGAQGSFKPVDDHPCFTVNLDKYKGGDPFHGFKKFHLNNSNEDPTWLRQMLCGEIARAGGVPAVRCTHAFVQLNGRDLGLYVFTESYTKDFLAQFFKNVEGDVYEGGFCKDIDADLRKEHGDEKDRSAIEQLLAACAEGDAAVRWQKLGAILDTDRFASFLAMEALLGVGDGYDFFHNNYRIYHDPLSGKLSFILHGMDEPLGDPGFDIQRSPESIVGRAFTGCAEGRALYRERVAALYGKVFAKRDWPARAGEIAKQVREAVAPRDVEFAKVLGARMEDFRGTVGERVKNIAKQLGEMPEPLAFDKNGIARLTKGWGAKNEDGAKIERLDGESQPCLRIAAEGDTKASWRAAVPLTRGRYRFEAKMKTHGVDGTGAGLRISGQEPAVEWTRGDADWRAVNYEFEVSEDNAEVVLVAELRASRGEARFALDSLRLVRAK